MNDKHVLHVDIGKYHWVLCFPHAKPEQISKDIPFEIFIELANQEVFEESKRSDGFGYMTIFGNPWNSNQGCIVGARNLYYADDEFSEVEQLYYTQHGNHHPHMGHGFNFNSN